MAAKAHALVSDDSLRLGGPLRLSREIGSFGVLTQRIDDEVRQFYRRWGFQDLPHDPKRAMIVRMIDLEKSGYVS